MSNVTKDGAHLMDTKRKVLLVAYWFPPLGGIGTRRAMRYVRYLPDFGWQCYVVTVADAINDIHRLMMDESLTATVPAQTKIVRTPAWYIGRLPQVFDHRGLGMIWRWVRRAARTPVPDECIGWLPFAYHAAKQMVCNEGIQVVYTVSEPFTAHMVGLLLKRRLGVSWVADFRDEWSQHPLRGFEHDWQRGLSRWLEQRVLLNADQVITVTESYHDSMASLVPKEMWTKFVTITNGYQAEDFSVPPIQGRPDKLRIVYVGLFYLAQQPIDFLSAVEQVVRERIIPRDHLQIILVGPDKSASVTADVSRFETTLGDIIEWTGYVSHREAVGYLKGADVLLLIASRPRGSRNIPGKTFEYIAAGTPILVLATAESAAAELVRQTGTGVAFAAPDDIHGIAKALAELYERWQNGTLAVKPDWSLISEYEGRRLTEKLSAVLQPLARGEGGRKGHYGG